MDWYSEMRESVNNASYDQVICIHKPNMCSQTTNTFSDILPTPTHSPVLNILKYMVPGGSQLLLVLCTG